MPKDKVSPKEKERSFLFPFLGMWRAISWREQERRMGEKRKGGAKRGRWGRGRRGVSTNRLIPNVVKKR
jgi:hypothetical protein